MSTVSPSPPVEVPLEPVGATTFRLGERYEVIDGKIVEKLYLGVFETWIASALSGYFHETDELRRKGRLLRESLFILGAAGTLKRRPDLAFVSYERWPRNRPVPKADAWDVIPDLAIEVISPSNGASEVLIKINHYFQAGVRAVWVVYPNEEMVYLYRSPTDVTVLTRSGTLEAQDVLPGFRLPLDRLFENPAPGE
ncbi:MAG: Uma2 family endonuclease [Isosphaeraceae bacterium]